MTIIYDPEKHFLGKLCNHNHDWENSGFSLRLVKNKQCVICTKERRQTSKEYNKEYHKLYRQENADKLREYQQNYRQENADKIREHNRNYYQENIDKILEQQQNYRQENGDIIRERDRNYYKKNADKICKYQHNYNQENADKIRERKRNYHQKNADKIREHKRNYRQENLDKIREYRKENADKIREQRRNYYRTLEGKNACVRSIQKRRAIKNKCHSLPYKQEDILSLFNGECAYCGSKEKLTLDHFIPITKGGSNVQGNLLPACRSCNCSKNSKDAIEWYKKQPFFNQKRWRQILKILGKTEFNCDQIPLF